MAGSKTYEVYQDGQVLGVVVDHGDDVNVVGGPQIDVIDRVLDLYGDDPQSRQKVLQELVDGGLHFDAFEV